MKEPYLLYILRSSYCKSVLILSLIGSYFLIPNKVFYGYGYFLAGAFMLVFSFSITCIVRNIKEKIKLSHTYKTSIFSLFLGIVGISAFQVCGIGAPVCGATIGLGIVSVIFPAFFIDFLTDYSHAIIIISIIMQTAALYFMKCLRIKDDAKQ